MPSDTTAAGTGTHAISFATNGDDFDVPATTALLAQSVDAALTLNEGRRQGYNYRWANDSERAAQTGMRAGDTGFQVDTGFYYTRVGGSWKRSGATNYQVSSTFTVGGVTNFGSGGSRVMNWIPTSPYTISYRVAVGMGSGSSGSGQLSIPMPTGITLAGGGEHSLALKFYAGGLGADLLGYANSTTGSSFNLYTPTSVSTTAISGADFPRLGTGGNFNVNGTLFVDGL